MVDTYIAALALPISNRRLKGYRPKGGTDLDMVANYLWNIELSQALYSCLCGVEVSLRNTIQSAASAHYDTPFWFDQQGVLLQGQFDQIEAARAKLSKSRKPYGADDIVAALTFGFWVSLFNSPFEHPVPPAPSQRLAWHDRRNRPTALLRSAFPYAPRTSRSRNKLLRCFNKILWLRNRVFHHEPIWNRPNLAAEHQDVVDTIAWISPAMRDTIELCDTFPTVLNQGHALAKAKIEALMSIL